MSKWFIYLIKVLDRNNLIDHDSKLFNRLSNQLDIYIKSLDDVEKLTDIVYRIKQIEQKTNHDLKACEYFLKELFNHWCPSYNIYQCYLHFGCTSEDVNNLSYGLMVKNLRSDFIVCGLSDLLDQLFVMITQYKSIPMLARTHGQPASPTTVGKELGVFYYRLSRQINLIKDLPILGKLAGAVGNYNAHSFSYPNIDWQAIAKEFIEDHLGLKHNPMVTQIESHDWVSELLDTINRINNICIDLCQDIWIYISYRYWIQKVAKNEVGSSIMPHKVNPIDFENAEGNFGVSSSLSSHLSNHLVISRMQRDLSDSTVMRSLGMCFGYHYLAVNNLIKGLKKLSVDTGRVNADLEANPEVLAEAIQTVMRKHQIKDAYEQLKDITRGQKISKDQLDRFVKNHQSIPQTDKDRLLALKVKDYVGLATKLCEDLNDLQELKKSQKSKKIH